MTYYLFTDLDRTLIPNGAHIQDKQSIKILTALHDSDKLKLIYVSGRDKNLIQSAIKEHGLPIPDLAIADVGARIYQIIDNKWENDQEWNMYLSTNWDDEKFRALGNELSQIAILREQEPEKQSRFKHSYYLAADDLDSAIDKTIHDISESLGLKIRIIKSLDETSNTGLLDILPGSASKYHAIRFLMDKYQFELENMVFSGDSGNDMEVLTSELPSILVKNAHHSVQRQAKELSKINSHEQQLYIADGDFFGLNGHYCSGILEGLAYYLPVFRKWIAELT